MEVCNYKNMVVSSYEIKNEDGPKAVLSPLGSCGLFSIRNLSLLLDSNNNSNIKFLQHVYVLSKVVHRYHCLCLDNIHNFSIYKDFINPFIYWEGTNFINYSSSNACKLFILDCSKIENFLKEKDLIPKWTNTTEMDK